MICKYFITVLIIKCYQIDKCKSKICHVNFLKLEAFCALLFKTKYVFLICYPCRINKSYNANETVIHLKVNSFNEIVCVIRLVLLTSNAGRTKKQNKKKPEGKSHLT